MHVIYSEFSVIYRWIEGSSMVGGYSTWENHCIRCYKRWRKRREVKEIKPQGDTRFNVENPLRKQLHYDRSPVTNTNGGDLQEVE
jgi:hypothetical protein